MLANLRLVIVDYPKMLIQSPTVKKILADILQARQISYERTNPDFIPFSPLDLISTHFLIYDCVDLHNPKLIMGVRMNDRKRCEKHQIAPPCDLYKKALSRSALDNFNKFKSTGSVVEASALFVDADYTLKKQLSQLLKLDTCCFSPTSSRSVPLVCSLPPMRSLKLHAHLTPLDRL